MLLIDVVADDTTKEPIIERRIYMCSACRHFARRLVLRRAQMPVTHLPVVPIPIDELWKERVAASSASGKAGEMLRSGQIGLKEVTSAAKTGAWMKAVEKLRSKQAALAEEAAIASRPKLAEPLQVPAAPSEP